MFSHVNFGTNDMGRAFPFYSEVFAHLDLELVFEEDDKSAAGWVRAGQPFPMIVLSEPLNNNPHQSGNGQMLAFLARDRQSVRIAHQIAMKLGGSDEGAPGLRPNYHENFYGAYFRDLDGNKVCICCHEPEKSTKIEN